MISEHGHILVVDDQRTNRLKLCLGLKQQGHTVGEAENGIQALEKLRSEVFDLVLLDILMPEMDGYQVLNQMKGDKTLREVPVIVISAMDDLESVVKGIELGAEDYLPKTSSASSSTMRVNRTAKRVSWRSFSRRRRGIRAASPATAAGVGIVVGAAPMVSRIAPSICR